MSRKLGYEVDVIGNLVPGDLTAYVLDDLVRRPPWPMLSHKLFENVNSLFANESDGYKTTSAPSAFRFSCGRNTRTGQEPTPEQSECHYRNRHQVDLSHRCRGRHRGSPASVLQSQAQETSSAADPATVFDRVNRFPSHPQIINDRLSPFANNVLPFALNLRGAAHIRK